MVKFYKLRLNTLALGLGLWLAVVSVAGGANQPALKDVLAKNFLIGAALNDDVVSGKDPDAAAIARQQFNTITAENVMKWEKIHPQPDKYDFEPADRYAELFSIFMRHKNTISRVTLWDVYDKTSCLNNWPVRGRMDYPLLFDRGCKPKFAFNAVV
jgi:GH35 family endo-1,4-beta-xylanase